MKPLLHPPYSFTTKGLRGCLRHNELMSKHTSWRVGGPAEWFYEPTDVEDLALFLQQLPKDIPLFWLGLGSNLLVREGGIRGVVILTAGLLNEMTLIDECDLRVEAGVSSAKVARFAAKAGLTGVEFLAGIPGTLGGALAMNAGAFGGEIWSVVRGVETLDRYGHLHRRQANDYEIGYRKVKGPIDEWFIAARLRLNRNLDPNHQQQIAFLLKKRSETQPIGLPSCGSVFRNPVGDYAGRLIEAAGWKGKKIGGAVVSEKHANFIINQGNATAKEIESLIKQIQESVKKKYGVQLETEVCIVGELLND